MFESKGDFLAEVHVIDETPERDKIRALNASLLKSKCECRHNVKITLYSQNRALCADCNQFVPIQLGDDVKIKHQRG